MVYYDDQTGNPLGHLPLPYDWRDEPRATPSEKFRPLIAAAVERHPNHGPSRLKSDLRRDGHDVPHDQICGFLVGM